MPPNQSIGMKAFLTRLLSGLLIIGSLPAVAATRYVNLNSPNPTSPYTGWSTAATNIQNAIDVAMEGDLVLVTNGIYQTGGRAIGALVATNRVAVTKAITLQSVNGATVTTISGYQMPGTLNGTNAIRCILLTNGSLLVGFTLSGGATSQDLANGGGAYCDLESIAILSNCVISGNSAGLEGGGAYGCVMYNCSVSGNQSGTLGGGASSCTMYGGTVSGNQAGVYGGGSMYSTLSNCTISANSAPTGGGGSYCSFHNCVVRGNSASDGGGAHSTTMRNCLVTENVAYGVFGGGGAYQCNLINCTVVANRSQSLNGGSGGGTYSGSAVNCIIFDNTSYSSTRKNYRGGNFSWCCTSPLPTSGNGNFISPPLLINQGGGDFRLQTNSLCINAGNNASVASSVDLDSNARIVGGTVDIGAYEFQSPSSLLSYVWAQQFGLATDGSSDFSDTDGDGMNNYGEWRSDTNPNNALSVLRMLKPTYSPSGTILTWQSVSTRSYWLERATDTLSGAQFQIIATDIGGTASTTVFVDASATNAGAYFYRIGVQ